MDKFDVRYSLDRLCNGNIRENRDNHLLNELRPYLSKQIWSPFDRQNILNTLTNILLSEKSNLTIVTAKYFSPLLLDLLYRAQNNENNKKKLFISLSKLIGHFSDATQFAYYYFNSNKCSPIDFIRESQSLTQTLDLLIASLNYLWFNQKWFQNSCDWSFITDYIDDTDCDIRWTAVQCFALLSNMSECELNNLITHKFSKDEEMRSRLKYFDIFNYRTPIVNLETRNIDLDNHKEENNERVTYTLQKFTDDDFCSDIVSVCGILIPILKCQNTRQTSKGSDFIIVNSVKETLQSLAIALSYGKPVMVQGPVGSGKTSLVEYLALQTNRVETPQLIKVQMGDQIDTKLLIGTYCCTDIPGEFVWKEGPLTKAMTNGYWLLLEDIDCAPSDVITMLASVLEGKSLSSFPGFNNKSHNVHCEFRIFFTRRLLSGYFNSQKFSEFAMGSASIIDKLCHTLCIESLPRNELSIIISTKWSILLPIIDRILDIYFLLQNDSSESEHHYVKRGISMRDLFKWCDRISHKFQIDSDETAICAFLDACDCFLMNLPNINARISKAENLGVKLNLSKSQSLYLSSQRKPEIQLTDNNFRIGRIALNRRSDVKSKCSVPFFAFTHQSLSLLERVTVAVKHNEPVLLCGETGTGKTSSVQYLANIIGQKLTVININQQSDSCDLIGGYKPIEMRFMIAPLKNEFEELFAFTFDSEKNGKFLTHILMTFQSEDWTKLFQLMSHVCTSALSKCQNDNYLERWKILINRISQLQLHLKLNEKGCLLSFSFIEGSLVKAMKDGSWILLDEINLAESETLQCLSTVLDNRDGSILLLEKADGTPVHRHPDFRLFACMNPATDIGKRELPLGIRNRFTELFVEELEDKCDLRIMIDAYLHGLGISHQQIEKIVQFYLRIREDSKRVLCDTTGSKPHYSLRSLCRALYVSSNNPCGNVQRSLYESFCLSFLIQLDKNSHFMVQQLICDLIFEGKNISKIIKFPIEPPVDHEDKYVLMEGYWISRGSNVPIISDAYILTSSVRKNLKDLVRVISIGKTFPVLLQGETSVGKTSMIQWLAKATGNTCVRVNNHEHTDLQEYIGSYSTDSKGKLVFKEGILVEAMRHGYWIILDELNLAPTEVLEALNRVLDDNRELFIPETQQTIKAHPKFLLFATQNPPGHYGGRKILSRAFRNRFVELHFDEIPSNELEIILHKRCALPLSYAKRMVGVLLDLQIRRRESGVFAGKHGFITLRDLFRWGERYRIFAENQSVEQRFYDWDMHLANTGYLILAGRVRKHEEVQLIKDVLEKRFKRKVEDEKIFGDTLFLKSFGENLLPKEFDHIVWTKPMKRLGTLLSEALKYNEPVLLVGDTGCGKTSICQLFAALYKRKLYTVNCHMHSESADFLGGLRPVRHNAMEDENDQRLFEWIDGPLIDAMNGGDFFLTDEISLADDSVLERLNSVLEPERTIFLAEKVNDSIGDTSIPMIVAESSFRYLATMNPGGDYGKKELSPALRNRFTEIWCPSNNDMSDVIAIIEHNLLEQWNQSKEKISKVMCEFLNWFGNQTFGSKNAPSVRDVLSWIEFMNVTTKSGKSVLSLSEAFINGAILVFVDAIGTAGVTSSYDAKSIKSLRSLIIDHLTELSNKIFCNFEIANEYSDHSEQMYGIAPFLIAKGPKFSGAIDNEYTFESPTVNSNVIRILRAMQLSKPILLEGIPGVGKTTLIQSLAKACGYEVMRINLSEQTDVSDLFGADLPIEGDNTAGKFAWRDGTFLRALKSDCHWIILDELNLASQSVLEGLNACLDHRGEIFIAELNKTFKISKRITRIFACQNPHSHGSARKGLPRSFLNRFTSVYIESLEAHDLEFILSKMYDTIPKSLISKMVEFNQQLIKEIEIEGKFGRKGSPWEFNLRDLFRWCQLIINDKSDHSNLDPSKYVRLIYADRMRSDDDSDKICVIFARIFGHYPDAHVIDYYISPNILQIGYSFLKKFTGMRSKEPTDLFMINSQKRSLQSVMKCIEMNWMMILVGPTGVGKTSIVRLISELTGHELKILSVNTEMDTMELLGGFEQKDSARPFHTLENDVEILYKDCIKRCSLKTEVKEISKSWFRYLKVQTSSDGNVNNYLITKLDILNEIIFTIQNLASDYDRQLIKRIKIDIENLRSALENASNGGSFEWVDSILVNALKNGDWLLIDNVNLCSASVLDRLNGLLEPKGVLFINEQGSIDGEIPVIKPHPEFRLILAMDPKNGELSRAMRNRGVEICINCYPNERDIIHLMQNLGISDLRICKLLHEFVNGLNIHSNSGAEFIAQNTMNLLEIYRNFTRQLQHISEFQSTLKESIENSLKLNITDDAINNFVEKIKLLNSPSKCDLNLLPLKFNNDSIMSIVTRDSIILDLIDLENSSLNLQLMHSKIDLCASTAIRIFFQYSSLSDFSLRQKIIKKRFNSEHFSVNSDLIINLTESIRKIFQNSSSLLMIQEYPIDLRHNSYAWDLIWDKNSQLINKRELIEKYINRWSMNLFWFQLKQIQCETDRSLSSECVNILQLSKDCITKKIPQDSVPKIIVPISDVLNEIEQKLVKSSLELSPSDDDFMTLREMLLWIHQLNILCSEGYSKDKLFKEIILDRFLILWSVVNQKSLSVLQSFLEIEINDSLSMINKHLPESFKTFESDKEKQKLINSFNCDSLILKSEKFANLHVKCIDMCKNIFQSSLVYKTIMNYDEIVIAFAKTFCDIFYGKLTHCEIDQNLSNIVSLITNALRPVTDDDDSQNEKMTEAIVNRKLSIELQFEPLIQLAFNYRELQSLCFSDYIVFQSFAKKLVSHSICLSPIHIATIDLLDGDMKNPTDLMLAHYSDFNRNMNVENIKFRLQSADSFNDDPIEFSSDTLNYYTIQNSPIVSIVCSHLLFGKSFTVGQMRHKRSQIEQLKQYITSNIFVIGNEMFDLSHIHSNFINQWHNSLIRDFPKLSPCKYKKIVNDQKASIRTLIESVSELLRKPKNKTNEIVADILVGLLSCHILAPTDSVDPIQKLSCKLDYYQMELNLLNTEIALRNALSILKHERPISDTCDHPIILKFMQRKDKLIQKIERLSSKLPSRPKPTQYYKLYSDIKQFLDSVIPLNAITLIIEKIGKCMNSNESPRFTKKIISELLHLQTSLLFFVEHIQKTYPLYKDLTNAFLVGICILSYGLKTSAHLIESSLFISKTLEFESTQECCDSINLLGNYCHTKTPLQIAVNLSSINTIAKLRNFFKGSDDISIHYISKVMISSLMELQNEHLISPFDANIFARICEILNYFVESWQKVKSEEEQKKLNDEALFQYKTKVHNDEESEETLEKREIARNFPSYYEEFNDIIQESRIEEENANQDLSEVNLDDEIMLKISRIHMEIIGDFQENSNFRDADFKRSFTERYDILTQIIKSCGVFMPLVLDSTLIEGHLVICQNYFNENIKKSDEKVFNIYRDFSIEETSSCINLLEKLELRIVNELLPQFPNHPTLTKIVEIINRIFSFSINTPLIKFVTGLEILLESAQDWQLIAHRGISLTANLEEISHLIIDLRKLELKYWTICLDSVIDRIEEKELIKWWFHLYVNVSAILEQQKNTESDSEIFQLISSLKQFMENCKLIQFNTRLKLLNTFMHHVKCSIGDVKNNKILNVFCNLYNYYKQFSQSVFSAICDQRKPIEKELKEFVKIVRWNDMNFWSVKQTVDKSHRTLQKFMKNFESSLDKPVKSAFLFEPSNNEVKIWKLNLSINNVYRDFTYDTTKVDNEFPDVSILKKLPILIKKMKQYSKKSLKSSSKICTSVCTINELSSELIEEIKKFASLQIVSDPKDKVKWKKEVKHIHNLKRKTLNDLFKTLIEYGLSYRKGLIIYGSLNLDNAIMNVGSILFDSDIFKKETFVFDQYHEDSVSCDKYFYKCLANYSLLQTAVESPSKQLTLGIIERLKGFCGHFMNIIINKRSEVSNNLINLKQLRTLSDSLIGFSRYENESILISKSELKHFIDFAHNHLTKLCAFLHRIKDFSLSLYTNIKEPIVISEEHAFTPTSESIENFHNKIDVMFQKINTFKSESVLLVLNQKYGICSFEDLAQLQSLYSRILIIINQLTELNSIMKLNNFTTMIDSLCSEMKDKDLELNIIFNKYNAIHSMEKNLLEESNSQIIDDINIRASNLVKRILLCIEKNYKYFTETVVNVNEEENISDTIHASDLTRIIKDLEMKKVTLLIKYFIKSINSFCNTQPDDYSRISRYCRRVMTMISPLIQLYLRHSEYFIVLSLSSLRNSNKLLMILLNLFCDIIQNGFCLPQELEESTDTEAGTEFKDIEDGGFGDGKGTKNVSEKIESEDQLDDMRKDDNKDNEDEDVNEEDNAIEMSDDFDGKANDPSKRDDDDDDDKDQSDDSDDDLEDKMGDVNDDGADILDKKMWESDDDGEESDTSVNDDDFDGQNDLNESKIAAKDDTIGMKNNDNEEKERKNDDEKIDEINEGNDMQNDEFDDKIDPYKNNDKPREQPLTQEISDDLNLDMNDDDDDNDNNDNENDERMSIDNDNIEEEGDEEMKDSNEDAANGEENDMNDADINENSENDQKGMDDAVEEQNDQKEENENNKSDENSCLFPDKSATEDENAIQSEFFDNSANFNNENVESQMEKDNNVNDNHIKSGDIQSQEQHGSSEAHPDDANTEGESGKIIKKSVQTEENINENQRIRPNLKDKSRRSLTDPSEKTLKRQKVIESDDKNVIKKQSENKISEMKSEMFQHVENRDDANNEVFDLANDDDAFKDKFEDKNDIKENSDILEVKNEEVSENQKESKELKPIVMKNSKQTDKDSNNLMGDSEDINAENIETDGDFIQTNLVLRGSESTFHTQLSLQSEPSTLLNWIETHSFDRINVENSNKCTEEAVNAWKYCENVVTPLVYELCEQLQLVLEPTKSAKLKGDYRNGKRLNMRKVIAYIASQFRKDKIWLRRTKLSKRQYQIVLAVDDSSSMNDNQSKQIAFESLALLAKSLSLIEAGELAIMSFGENVRLLHAFGEPFTDDVGAKLLCEFTFKQNQTRIVSLLNTASSLFLHSHRSIGSIHREISQLLLIVSDGRGLFSEGENVVHEAIRRIRDIGIFMVFVVIDNPKNKDSILDIRVPIFEDSGNVRLESYMEKFPFPFYLILRDINSMPIILGEALRQWFELISSSDR